MIDKIKSHIEEAKAFHADNKEKLEEFRIKYLGNKGLLKELFADFRNVPNEMKKEFGQIINELKNTAEAKVASPEVSRVAADTSAAVIKLPPVTLPVATT